MKIHSRKDIKQTLRQQGASPSWLAKQLCCNRTNVYNIFKRESIDTILLQRISKALDTDFFRLYVNDSEEG